MKPGNGVSHLRDVLPNRAEERHRVPVLLLREERVDCIRDGSLEFSVAQRCPVEADMCPQRNIFWLCGVTARTALRWLRAAELPNEDVDAELDG